MQATTGIQFRRTPPGSFSDWHNAPRRQYVITLEGQMEIGLGDGTKRIFNPGDVLLADDRTGRVTPPPFTATRPGYPSPYPLPTKVSRDGDGSPVSVL